MYWEEKVRIPAYIADRTDHLDIWGLARLTQEAADHHTESTGCGFADMLKKNYAWVLVRMYYHIHRLPAVGETITIRTWSRGCDGLMFVRDAEVVDQHGEKLVGLTTVWVIINYSNRKLCKMSDFLSGYEHHQDKATPIDNLRRLKLPAKPEDCYVKHVPVEESMIDHNNHVNNAEYLKVIFNALSDLNIKREEISFEINYLQETNIHDTLKVERWVDGKRAYFVVSNSNGISVTSKVCWT